MSFDVDDLVSRLRDAVLQGEPAAAVLMLMRQVFADPAEIAAGVPEYPDDDVVLYEDDSVSIWHCRFQPDLQVPPHDHQTTATIGVYKGAELNRFYVRESGKLTHKSTRHVVAGDVIANVNTWLA